MFNKFASPKPEKRVFYNDRKNVAQRVLDPKVDQSRSNIFANSPSPENKNYNNKERERSARNERSELSVGNFNSEMNNIVKTNLHFLKKALVSPIAFLR